MLEMQAARQGSVQKRIGELADSSSRSLGISRRRVLTGSGGMTAAFLAMNEVFGPVSRSAPVNCLTRKPAQKNPL